MSKGEIVEGWTYSKGAFCFHEKIIVPANDYLRHEIMGEAHKSKFTIHRRSTKI